jgi:hypothetical protein
MDNFMIGFVLILVTVFAARVISNRALKKLDQEQKAKLVDLFSGDNFLAYGILIGILVLFFLSLRNEWLDATMTYIIYFVAILSYMLILSYRSYQKLKRNKIPDHYIRAYIISSAVRVLGLVVFLVLV